MKIEKNNNTEFLLTEELDSCISSMEFVCPKCDGVNKYELFVNSIVIKKGFNVELRCEYCGKHILKIEFK